MTLDKRPINYLSSDELDRFHFEGSDVPDEYYRLWAENLQRCDPNGEEALRLTRKYSNNHKNP